MKKLFKENKVLFVLGSIVAVSLVIIVICLLIYFFFGNNGNSYGNRLDGIENVKLDSNKGKTVKELYKDNDAFNDLKFNLHGKIIYITIDLKKLITLEDAKSLALKSLEAFSDEEKAFYDIQYIITAETLEENNLYPIMGYKNNDSTAIIWMNKK